MSLFFPFYEAQRGSAEPSRTPCEGFRVMLSHKKRGVGEPMAKIGDWYQQWVGKRCEVILELLKIPSTFVVMGLSQYWYLRDRDLLFALERKRCYVQILSFHIHFCYSWDNFIPSYPFLPRAVQQPHQERTLHRTQQLLNVIGDYQKTPQQVPQNTGRSLPAAGHSEDQQSNIPGTKRVRSHRAQASSHTAPVGLEIPSCTAAPAPTCSSSLYRERIREHLTPSVCKTQTGGGKYLDKETGVKIPALGNPDFIREVCRNE